MFLKYWVRSYTTPHSAESGVISLSKFFINLMICWPTGQIFRTFYTYDAVHINQSWAVDNAMVILRPKPSKFFLCLQADFFQRFKVP